MTTTQTHVMGKDAVLARNTGTVASPVWNPIDNCRDLTLGDAMTEVDVSARDGGGFNMVDVALQSLELSFQMVGDYADADFVALQTAYWARSVVLIATASGTIATSGTQYVKMAAKITKFEKGEELDGVTMWDITIKPTRAKESSTIILPTWVTVP